LQLTLYKTKTRTFPAPLAAWHPVAAGAGSQATSFNPAVVAWPLYAPVSFAMYLFNHLVIAPTAKEAQLCAGLKGCAACRRDKEYNTRYNHVDHCVDVQHGVKAYDCGFFVAVILSV